MPPKRTSGPGRPAFAQPAALKALLTAYRLPAVVLATDGTVAIANAAEAERLGLPLEDLSGHDWCDLLSADAKATWRERVRLGLSSRLPAVYRDTQGGVVVETSVQPVLDTEGNSRGLAVVTREIPSDPVRGEALATASVRSAVSEPSAERWIQQEQEKTARLEALGALAGGIAHDFNNQLAAILANVSLAEEMVSSLQVTPPLLAQSLAAAERAVLRARDLTQQLLAFARGGAPLREPTPLSVIVRHAARFALSGSQHRADIQVAPELWPCEADPMQITQVLNNLVMNAARSMESAGTIRVTAANHDVEEGSPLPLAPGRYVKVGVADSGPVIPLDEQEHVFDPFRPTGRREAGLSLATAFAAIRRHEGHLMVESPPEGGAVFTFFLPASPEAACEPGTQSPVVPVRGSGRILVMDDEPFLRSALIRMLTSLGYEAEGVPNGEQAVRRYARALDEGRRFDAVIMDLTIPGGRGGAEVVQDLLALDATVRAIASSGYATAPIMAEYREHGFAGRLPKPYTLQEASEVLARVLAS